MPTLTIPDVPAAALARLRAAADRAGRTVEEEARDRLRDAFPVVDDNVAADHAPPPTRTGPRLGPVETPEGLPPRRYSATMSEARKRVLEDVERRTATLSAPYVSPEELKRRSREGAE